MFQLRNPATHMRLARRAFERDRLRLAASEVEKLAAGVQWFEEQAHGAHSRALRQALVALQVLEMVLRAGQVDSVRLLDDVFADTMRALEGDIEPADAADPAAPADP